MSLRKKATAATPAQNDAELQRLRGENKRLKKLAADLQSQYESLAASKWKLPTTGKGPGKSKAFVRLVVPDTHGSHIDADAVNAMFRDLESLQVKEVVLLGDHLDCGGFLAQHFTLGYVADTAYTFADDVTAANQFLDRLQSLTPKAKIWYLEGNHEERIERWAITTALRSGTDAQFLLSTVGAESQLSLKKRGIDYVRRSEYHDGLRVRGTIRLGSCHFSHGKRHGVNATRQILTDFGCNVVHGHTHTAAAATKCTVKEGMIASWCPGCLCKLQPYYDKRDPTPSSHGYGLQLVRENGDFLHLNVPIIDGVSYLVHLADELGRG